MEKKNFSYSEYDDSLIVSNKQENEAVRENFEIGDIIFSLTGKGKIVAIEIREFSSFLESCDFNPEIAKSLTNVQLNILPKKGMLFMALRIEFLEQKVILTKSIPLVVPIITH